MQLRKGKKRTSHNISVPIISNSELWNGKSKNIWTTVSGILTLCYRPSSQWFQQTGTKPGGCWVGFPPPLCYCTITLSYVKLYISSNEAIYFYALWNETLLQSSNVNMLPKIVSILLKIDLHALQALWGYFICSLPIYHKFLEPKRFCIIQIQSTLVIAGLAQDVVAPPRLIIWCPLKPLFFKLFWWNSSKCGDLLPPHFQLF